MGLSGKQGLGWISTDQTSMPVPAKRNQQQLKPQQQQQQQQQHELLECPRCGSTNTKFCYYNNYNKSQPRHLCKACKRHWTKGGTLRNVPVGGGRKNKRVKLSSNTTAISAVNIPKGGGNGDHSLALGGAFSNQKRNSDTIFQALIHPPSSLQNGAINNLLGKAFMASNGCFSSGSNMLMPSQDQSMKFSFPNSNDQFGRIDTSMESTITTTSMPTTSCISSQPWQQDPVTSAAMDDFPSYWSWNNMDSFISADLDIPWSVDTEIEF